MRVKAAAVSLCLVLLAARVAQAACDPVSCADYGARNPYLGWQEIDPRGVLDYVCDGAGLAVKGDVAWLATYNPNSLVSYDLSDPGDIRRIGTNLVAQDALRQVLIVNDIAYTTGDGLCVFDVAQPQNPRLLSRIASGSGRTYGEACYRYGLLYLAAREYTSDRSLRVIDVRNPANPVLVNGYNGAGAVTDVEFSGDRLVTISDTHLSLWEPAPPADLRLLGQAACAGEKFVESYLALQGDLAYVRTGRNLHVFDLGRGPTPVLLATVPFRHAGRVLAGPSRVYVSDELDGLFTYDTSDPAAPVLISRIPGVVGVRDLAAYDGRVLATMAGSVLQMLDPEIQADPTLPVAVPMSQSWFNGIATANGVAYVPLDGGRGGTNRLVAYDVRDKDRVTVLGELTTTLPLYNPQVHGKYIVFDHLVAVDVTDPANMRVATTLKMNEQRVLLRGNVAYMQVNGTLLRTMDVTDITRPLHLGWSYLACTAEEMALDGDILVVAADGKLGTADVSDPRNVVPLGSLTLPVWCQNLEVRDHLVYIAGKSGELGIIDISDPEQPRTRSLLPSPDRSKNSPLALGDGVVYLNSHALGAVAVDVSDPDHPRPAGVLPMAFEAELLPSGFPPTLYAAVALTDRYVLSVRTGIGLTIAERQCGDIDPVVGVTIDVEPRDRCHRVPCGPRAHGRLEVAVLTTTEFDALSVDPASARFGPGQAREIHYGAKASPDPDRDGHGRGPRRHAIDVDCDGDLDLMLHFDAREVAFACGDSVGELVATTLAGTAVCGEGAVTTGPHCGPRPGAGESVAMGDKSLRGGFGCRDGGDKDGAPTPAYLAAPTLSPNPLNPATTIAFELGAAARLSVAVFDIAGRLVARLADGELAAGTHRLEWRGADDAGRAAPSGVYFVKIEGGGLDTVLRAALIR